MRIVPTVLCALFFATTTACQEIKWREITIESRHAGLEISRDLTLVIQSHNGVIVSGKRTIEPQLGGCPQTAEMQITRIVFAPHGTISALTPVKSANRDILFLVPTVCFSSWPKSS